jgi:hypothetical protein
MAQQLAVALVDRASRDGFVVGLEGEWGSGKTSMLALARQALRKLPPERRPIVLSFQPWLIGNSDALLTAFFDDLSRTIESASGAASGLNPQNLKRIANELRTYGSRLAPLASLASLADIAGVPWAGPVGTVLKYISRPSKQVSEKKPIAAAKAEINKALAHLTRRIVILIDDVDRLEPSEIAEVLRLVRSVADFQNVVYVLCYDPGIISTAVEKVMRIPDGQKYLEKIVQVSIRVPAPEPFALRRMFSRGLGAFAQSDDDEESDGKGRLALVIDQHGGDRLTTPRSVNRALDLLRFMWPSLRGKVDLSDLVWLQLVRITNPGLYSWIETYVATMAAVSTGRASVESVERKSSYEALKSALQTNGMTFKTARWQLGQYLPGLSSGGGNKDGIPLFGQVTERTRLAAIKGKRLASPDHHRLYFAFSTPSGAPQEADFVDLWNAADAGREHVEDLFTRWFADVSSGISTKAELMLDRLGTAAAEYLNSQRSTTILLALANVLDSPAVLARMHELGGPASWREAGYLLPILLGRIEQHDAKAMAQQAFRDGQAIGWLVDILRKETFAHGKFGDRQKPEDEWLFSEEVFEAVVGAMHERFNRMTIEEVLATPDPISLLFAWNQSGGSVESRSLIERSISSDHELVTVLEHMATSMRSSAEGKYPVIKRDALAGFINPDEAYERVAALADGGGNLSNRAAKIKEQFDKGDEW